MKKLFFLALLAFALPMSTWANETGEEWGTDSLYNEDSKSIETASVSLKYKILTAANPGDPDNPGTVELEGLADSNTSANIGALSVAHIIVHAEYNATTQGVDIDYYEVTGIAQDAFTGNTTLTSITIPYTVAYIGSTEAFSNGAFYNCTGLTTVAFAETTNTKSQLTTIGLNAFNGCTNLANIDIPATVTSLGGSAFRDCTSLTEVKLPESVTMITAYCFNGCSNLTTVWLSGSASLYSNCFAGCTSLSAFVLEGSTPATTGGAEASGSGWFDGDYDDVITLYVPTGSAPAYLQTNWVSDMNDSSSANPETLQWNFNSTSVPQLAVDGDGVYYATYCTDAVGEFYTDVTPNIITESSSIGELTVYPVSGVFPAGAALLLTANTYGDTYYYHPYGVTANDVTATLTNNMLYGNSSTTTATTATVGDGSNDDNYYFYMLSLNADNEDGSVGFYWGNDTGAPFECAASKAWLAVEKSVFTSGVKALSFKHNDDTTGISEVEAAANPAVEGIYTLQGVRVSDMSKKGVYIVNGKKVLVK